MPPRRNAFQTEAAKESMISMPVSSSSLITSGAAREGVAKAYRMALERPVAPDMTRALLDDRAQNARNE